MNEFKSASGVDYYEDLLSESSVGVCSGENCRAILSPTSFVEIGEKKFCYSCSSKVIAGKQAIDAAAANKVAIEKRGGGSV